ncbi:hypothetical protein SprV_0401411900 [Sparganum proliferum]
MSDRPHRARKPNKKYDKRDFVSGDEQSSSSKSESLSESSDTIPGCMSSSFLRKYFKCSTHLLDDTSQRPTSSTPRRKRRLHDSRTSTKDKKKKRQYWMLYSQREMIQRLTDLCSKVDNLEAQVRRLVAASTPLPIEEGPAWQQVSSLAAYDRLCAALSDGQYRRRLICYLSGAGGENTSAFAGRIFNTLFTEDVTEFLTFYGKKPGSRAFFGSQIYDLILDVFNKWCASHASDRQKLEDAFKNVFKRAHDRQQRKCNKASTSVFQNDTQPSADLDKTPNENL